MNQPTQLTRTIFCVSSGASDEVYLYYSQSDRVHHGLKDEDQWFDLDAPLIASNDAIAQLVNAAHRSQLYLFDRSCRAVNGARELAKYLVIEDLKRYEAGDATVSQHIDDGSFSLALHALVRMTGVEFEEPDWNYLTVSAAIRKAKRLIAFTDNIAGEISVLQHFFEARRVKAEIAGGSLPKEPAILTDGDGNQIAEKAMSDPMSAAAHMYSMLIDVRDGVIGLDAAKANGLDDMRAAFAKSYMVRQPVDQLGVGDKFKIEADYDLGAAGVIQAGEAWTVESADHGLVRATHGEEGYLLYSLTELQMHGCVLTKDNAAGRALREVVKQSAFAPAVVALESVLERCGSYEREAISSALGTLDEVALTILKHDRKLHLEETSPDGDDYNGILDYLGLSASDDDVQRVLDL